jgi:hypothetical protein
MDLICKKSASSVIGRCSVATIVNPPASLYSERCAFTVSANRLIPVWMASGTALLKLKRKVFSRPIAS